MVFQDVVFLPCRATFTPYFLKIMVEVKASGPPHVLGLWLGVSKRMLPVGYFCSNKSSFCAVCLSEVSWRGKSVGHQDTVRFNSFGSHSANACLLPMSQLSDDDCDVVYHPKCLRMIWSCTRLAFGRLMSSAKDMLNRPHQHQCRALKPEVPCRLLLAWLTSVFLTLSYQKKL